jgi:hypothetical protein
MKTLFAIMLVLVGFVAPVMAQTTETPQALPSSACISTKGMEGGLKRMHELRCQVELEKIELELAIVRQKRRAADADAVTLATENARVAGMLARPVQFTATSKDDGTTTSENISATKEGAEYKLKIHELDTKVLRDKAKYGQAKVQYVASVGFGSNAVGHVNAYSNGYYVDSDCAGRVISCNGGRGETRAYESPVVPAQSAGTDGRQQTPNATSTGTTAQPRIEEAPAPTAMTFGYAAPRGNAKVSFRPGGGK